MDLTALVSRLEKFGRDLSGKPVFRWGIVTSSDPLKLQLDGDGAPLAGSPATLVGDLQVGDRVRVEQQAARLTVHGKALATQQPTGFEAVGVMRVPVLSHPAGVQKVDLVRSSTVVLNPGLYRVQWQVRMYISWGDVTKMDASGAYMHVYRKTSAGWEQAEWLTGVQVESWGAYWPPGGYGTSTPEGWLQVDEPGAYEFVGGLHSYYRLKITTDESAMVVEKFPRALEINANTL